MAMLKYKMCYQHNITTWNLIHVFTPKRGLSKCRAEYHFDFINFYIVSISINKRHFVLHFELLKICYIESFPVYEARLSIPDTCHF